MWINAFSSRSWWWGHYSSLTGTELLTAKKFSDIMLEIKCFGCIMEHNELTWTIKSASFSKSTCVFANFFWFYFKLMEKNKQNYPTDPLPNYLVLIEGWISLDDKKLTSAVHTRNYTKGSLILRNRLEILHSMKTTY